MELKPVLTSGAPTPVGHYSQAIIYGGLVFVSGQLGIDPADPRKPLGSVETQTEQVLENIRQILRAANSDLNRVLKMTVYVSDISLWDAVNATYKRVMGEHRPARAVVPTKELHSGYQVEIEAIAASNV